VGVDFRGEVVLGDDTLGMLQGGGAQEGGERLAGERRAHGDPRTLLWRRASMRRSQRI
jgi:hypothetical protein